MKRIVILALVASAPALMAQTAAPQGPAGAAPAATPIPSPATTIVFSEKGANGMSDLPMGVHRIPDSNVVISGQQGGVGMLFGVVGMLVQSSINAADGAGKVRNVEDDLRFDVRARAIEMTNTIMAGDKFRTAFTLTPQPGSSTMTVSPYVVLTFVKKTQDVRPYVVLKTKVTDGTTGDKGKAIKYFCCEGKALPLASLTENNGALLKQILTDELGTALDVMLLDRSQSFPRNDEAKVATNGFLPFVGKPLKWRGFDMGRYKDYNLIEFRGGAIVFSGVNIVEPGALEITPVVKK
jgi:hypothetical protein